MALDRLIVPAVVTYTAAQQDEAADELLRCSKCVMLQTMLIDYGVMRDQSRVALGR